MNPLDMWMLSPAGALYLASVASAVVAVCGAALLLERRRPAAAPARHAILLVALVSLLGAPAMIGLGTRAGWGLIPVALSRAASDPDATASGNALTPPAAASSPNRLSIDASSRELENVDVAPASADVREGSRTASLAPMHDISAHSASTPSTIDTHDSRSAAPYAAAPPVWLIVATTVAGLWLAGTTVAALRIARGLLRVRSIRRGASPANEAGVSSAAHFAAKSVGIRRSLDVRWADVPSPVTIGAISPAILLPRAAPSGDYADLRVILLHEAAHVARRDPLVGLAQRISSALFWWIPLIGRLNRRLADVREEICDNWVLRCGGDRRALARLLLGFAERAAAPSRLPAAACMADGSPHALERRVRALLAQDRDCPVRVDRVSRAAVLVFALLLGAMLSMPGLRAASVDETIAPESSEPQESVAAEKGARPDRGTHYISPDGRRVAFPRVVGSPGVELTSLVIREIGGAESVTLLGDHRTVEEILWVSRDVLAFTIYGSDEYELLTVEGKTAGRFHLPRRCEPFAKSLSPDGRHVAFAGKYGEQHGLFVADLETHVVRRLLDVAVKTAPTWSRDSRRIAIGGAGGYQKDYPLVVVDVASGESRKLPVNGVGVAWSPSGRYLAYTTDVITGGSWAAGIPSDGRIGVWDFETEKSWHATPPAKNESDSETNVHVREGAARPVWSPDERWLLYQKLGWTATGSSAQIRHETWLVRRDGTEGRKVLHHLGLYAWMPDSRSFLWTFQSFGENTDGRVWLDELPDLGPTEPRPEGRFAVEGFVRDIEGRPVPGVAITVARGMGTLFPTPAILTDERGWFRVDFGPGIFGSDGVVPQFALVHARKEGLYEQNFCEHGNLGMSDRLVEPGQFPASGFVYPGYPYRVDFTMVEAARLRGVLVDPDGEPLGECRVGLFGEKMPPGHSVLDVVECDDEGRFEIDVVPLETYSFRVREGRKYRVDGPQLNFDDPGDYEVRLVLEKEAKSMEIRVVSRPKR